MNIKIDSAVGDWKDETYSKIYIKINADLTNDEHAKIRDAIINIEEVVISNGGGAE